MRQGSRGGEKERWGWLRSSQDALSLISPEAMCHPVLQLYTQEFYEDIVKPRLNPGGIFVTQSGPAGVLTSREVSFRSKHPTTFLVLSLVSIIPGPLLEMCLKL